jgi:hypothetical protein
MLNHIKMRDKLPKLPSGFVTEYDTKQINDNQRYILSAARARDIEQAREYLELQQVEMAADIEGLFQANPIPDRKKRLKNWLMRMLGETTSDRAVNAYFTEKRLEEKGQIKRSLWENQNYTRRQE